MGVPGASAVELLLRAIGEREVLRGGGRGGVGQGQGGGGRYAKGRGVNPLALLAVSIEGTEPQPAWNATRVRLTRISAKGELVTAGHPQGSYRSDLIGI